MERRIQNSRRRIQNTQYSVQIQSVTREEFETLNPEVGALVLVDNLQLYIGVRNEQVIQWWGIQLSKP
jgi:hypothetical protein